MKVSPETQAGRDAEGGVTIIMTDLGGSIPRAEAELKQMMEGIARAPRGEARTMLERDAAVLRAGIAKLKANPAQKPSGGTVRMIKGKDEYDIPADKVADAEARGFKRIK
jgi:hypothetical protein